MEKTALKDQYFNDLSRNFYLNMSFELNSLILFHTSNED